MDTLKTAVFTLHDASTITVKDTADAPNAKSALNEFKAYKTAKLVDEQEKVYLVPFHAVIKVEVTETEKEAETVEDTFCPKN